METAYTPVLCILLLLQCSFATTAQKTKPADSIAFLYEYDLRATNTDIDREHIPLDGDSVRFIPFRKDKLYGFVDKQTKKLVIQPKFTQVYAVYKEGAIVEFDEGYGLVGYDGRFIVPAYYRNLFKEGELYHALDHLGDTTMDDRHDGFIRNIYFDKEGKVVFNVRAHRFATFNDADSLAWFRYGTKYSVYNRAGKLVKEWNYDKSKHFLGIFNDVLVDVTEGKTTNTYTGTDVQGRKMFEVPMKEKAKAVFRLSNTVFCFMLMEDDLILADGEGTVYPYHIANSWYGAGYVAKYLNTTALIPVEDWETEKMGYMNKHGQLVIPCKFDHAGEFKEGLAPYLDTAKRAVGFIDTSGSIAIQPLIPQANFEKAQTESQELGFSEGLCKVYVFSPEKDAKGRVVIETDERGRIKYRVAYLDRSGAQKILLPKNIAIASDFHDGRAAVVSDSGALGFIDMTGKMVIPMKYELAVAGAYPFPQLVYPVFKNGYAYLKGFKGYIDRKGFEYFSGKREKDHYDFSH